MLTGRKRKEGRGGGALLYGSLALSLYLTQRREKEGKIEEDTFRTSTV